MASEKTAVLPYSRFSCPNLTVVMSSSSPPTITQLLVAWNQGDQTALDQLTPLVYRELRRLAHGYLAGERQGHVLQTTALVNEAFVRLIDWQQVEWQNRAHFFGVAATLMRYILVQFAREQQAAKRGGAAIQISLSEVADVSTRNNPDLVALDDALNALEKLDPRQARTVELRFFGGLSLEEAAEVLHVSLSTVRRDWRMAQAWLHQQLSASP
jgi:RNA polymerase sigma-70 factor, ECF subfamily